ncbi:MAG: FecR domain-containing protein [Armatimonadetes bacterium]|nr:FecR domain-containing protein [Armatimonadota bacterium]
MLRPSSLLLLMLALALLCGTSSPDQMQLAANQAVLSALYGDVQVRHGTSGYHPGRQGEKLVASDAVKTGANSRAQLSLRDGRYVRLDQKTQLLLTHVQADGLTRLRALVGGVWVTIEQKLGQSAAFELETPSVVCAVRGTAFDCQVSDDGESVISVFDGEVEVAAEQERVTVRPELACRHRRGLRLALAALDLERREAEDFIQYNRHRDALQNLGNPEVLVCLSEGPPGQPRLSSVPTRSLTTALWQRGFSARPLSPEELRAARPGPQGWLRPAAQADYLLLGRITLSVERAPSRRQQRVVAVAQAYLLTDGDTRTLVDVSARAEASGATLQQASLAAMTRVGNEIAARMVPEMLREMCAAAPGAIRVELTDPLRGEARQALVASLKSIEGVQHVKPLPRQPGAPLSLLVLGAVSPEAMAAALRTQAPQVVQSATAVGRVVRVRSRPIP